MASDSFNMVRGMRLKIFIPTVFILSVLGGCVDGVHVERGLYNGLAAAERNRRTNDPSYNPITASALNLPDYDQYRREREKQLQQNDAVH